MDSGGPYLNAALLCERVLQEKDGVLSLIRLVDRVVITAVSTGGIAPDVLPPSVVSFHLLIVLKSGVYKGTAPVRLVIHSPSETQVGESSVDVFFEGDDRGVNLILPMQLQINEDGAYWISVFCMGTLFTRIPLRVVYQRVSQGSLRWPQNPQSS